MQNYGCFLIAALFLASPGPLQDGRSDSPSKAPAGEGGGAKKVPSLLKNGSFEGEISGYGGGLFGSWAANLPSSPNTKYEFDTKFTCDGEQSLALKNSDPKVQNPLSFVQALSGPELAKWQGRELTLSACLKTEDAGFADVRVEALDSKGKNLDWLSLTGGGIKGTRDWKRSEAALVISEKIASLRIYCVLQGQGSAWFDDVRLTVVPLEKTKHLEPLLGEALDRFCRFVRAKRGSDERTAREDLESLRSSASIEMVRSTFAKGFSYPDPKAGAVVEEDLRLGGRTVYQVFLPSGYDTKKKWPLLLDLSKPGVGQPWADGEGKRFLIARPKNLVQDRGGDGGGMSAAEIGKALPEVLAVLRDVRAKFAVEPDKVCVLGEAERADLAAAVALGNRGEFSSVVLLRPVALPSGAALANGSGLPMFLALEGGDRSPLAPGFESLRSKGVTLLVRDLDPARVAAVALGSDIFRWFEAKSRPALGQGFQEVLPTTADLGSHSVRVLAFAPGAASTGTSAKMQVKFEKRRMEIALDGISRIRVLFSLDEIGKPGEIEIAVNGETRYQGRPSFDFDAFLENLRFHADSRRLWGAQLDLDVK